MKRIDFNRGWNRRVDEMLLEMFVKPGSEIPVNLPDDFALCQERTPNIPTGANTGFIPGGQGIYTKKFDVPAEWTGKTVLLNLDGAYMNAEISVNGEQLALHPYGYTPFQVDLTPVLMPGYTNKIQIVTQSRLPNSRWYPGGGLYRDVCLYVGDACRIEPWDIQVITESASRDAAVVSVSAAVTCDRDSQTAAKCTAVLTDAAGNTAAASEMDIVLAPGKTTAAFQLPVKAPQLWDDLTPYLYTLTVTVNADGQEPDVITKNVGIRTITIDAKNGMAVNGRRLKLFGGCIHHDNTLLGACAFPRAEERKIQLLKDAGFNAIRTAHNPPSDVLLDVCDRLGVYVLDESFDAWRNGKNGQDYHLYFEEWWERDTTYMVLRDRNHPSVFCWSIGNEITESDGTSNADYWTKVQVDLIHKLDPSRPVTLGGMFFPNQPGELGIKWDNPDMGDGPMGPPPMEPFEKSQKLKDTQMSSAMNMMNTVDILSLNYSMERYEFLGKKFPDMPIMGTETKSHYAYENYQAVMANDHVIGDFTWTAYDYLGEAGAGRGVLDPSELQTWLCGDYPWLSSYMGDLDMDGKRRPQSYYRSVLWGKDHGVHLYARHPSLTGKHLYGMGWHWSDVQKNWTFEDQYRGKTSEVEAYADCDCVEFYCNGKLVGTETPEKYIAKCNVPYEPGILSCKAIKDGVVIAEDAIETTGPAAQIVLSADRSVITADGQDLSFITAYVADEQGRVVVTNDYELSAVVSGAGSLAGFGSANPCTAENYGTGKRFVFEGYALLCVRSEITTGEIQVSVSCDGLKSAALTVVCQ